MMLYSTAVSSMYRVLFQYSRLLKTPFKLSFNASRNGTSTRSLGNLFLYLTSFTQWRISSQYRSNSALSQFAARLFEDWIHIWAQCCRVADRLCAQDIQCRTQGSWTSLSVRWALRHFLSLKISAGQGPPASLSSCFLLTPAHLITLLNLLITQVQKKGQHLLQI